MTYVLLSLAFLAVAVVVLAIALAVTPDRAVVVRRWWAPVLIGGVIVLVLTAVFDNVMIGAGLMTYGEGQLAGVHLGLVPVEDFAYPIAGILLLPAVWLLTRRRAR